MRIPNLPQFPQFKDSRWTFLMVGAGIAAITLGISTVVVSQVFWGDDSELKKSTIMARINEETTIYTLDEQTRIGSFFDDAHRSYVDIDQIPAHMIRAMVASEDKNFYNHAGIDPVAISQAGIEGLFSGFRFRRGGSTITQQTVKNIMDRREHTFKRKFKEMIRALQLERMYSKNQILEFYLNQFHVTANGRGVGIAAQYYFNKDVRDLTLVEAAFIAGSVKAPSKYNPFLKYTEEAKESAKKEADARKNYVLRRMYEQGWITEAELKEAWDQRVPFRQGKFRNSEVALVSLIRGQVNKPEILEALQMENISDLDNAGLKIYTTIDAPLQDQAQLMLRRNLSRLESILQGFKAEKPEAFKPLRDVEPNQFYYAKVIKAQTVNGKPQIDLDFGLPKGVIPADAIERHARILDLPNFKGYQVYMKEIMASVKPGDVIFVEVKEYNPETHQAVAELKQKPIINGGLIAVDKGEVRAVVAGFDPIGYNRAMFATRQPGSTFKSVVYFAGLTLGWTINDRLDNQRRVFPFQGKFYYPRPDHLSPYKETSMLWSGVKSENLASVYLTDHLLDKLNFGQFKHLMGTMDLLPYQGENPRDYHYRVAKETGVQLDNIGIREHLLTRTVDELRPDFIFSGRSDLMDQIAGMWWGRGYVAELQNLYTFNDSDFTDKERNVRINLIKNNYERLSVLATELTQDWEVLQQIVGKSGAEGIFNDERGKTIVTRFRVLTSAGNRPELGYIRSLPEETQALANARRKEAVLDPAPGRALNALDVQAIWGDVGAFGERANLSVNDVKLSGYLPLSAFNRVRQGLEERVESVMGREDKYNLYRYFNHHDFRIILGLKYLVDLSKSMGVYSKLEPVLSFPLGTNVVSVAEVAKIYQTFTDGKIYRFYKDGPPNQLNFIRRIEDRDGNVLFEPKREEFQLADACVASQMGEILSKVVTHGTGSRARGELHISLDEGEGSGKTSAVKIRVPAFGKTGTTNDYTTAYFAGWVPYPAKEKAPLESDNAYTIASYVGYDFNKTMRRGGYRISGAYGALPVWTDFAKALIKEKKYADSVDRLDINLISRQVWPMKYNNCTTLVSMDLPQGAVISGDSGAGSEVFQYTDFEKEGEVYINEFEQGVVRSTVHLATTFRNGQRSIMREYKPFTREKKENAKPFEETSDPSLDNNTDGGQATGKGAPALQPIPVTEEPKPLPAEASKPQEPAKPEPKGEDLNPLERSIKKLNELFQPGAKKEEKPAETDNARRRASPPPPPPPPQPTVNPTPTRAPAPAQGGMIPKEEDDPGYTEEDLW